MVNSATVRQYENVFRRDLGGGKKSAVCCIMVQCVAVCCSVLQIGEVWCSVVQCGAVSFSVLPCVQGRVQSVWRTKYVRSSRQTGLKDEVSTSSFRPVCKLQRVAVCCSVLKCVVVCCSVLQYLLRPSDLSADCSVLQCFAVCCSVSQCVAVCRSALQCVAV